MKKEMIILYMKTGILRQKQLDKEKTKSIIKSAEINARVAKTVLLNEDSATLIFREIYESIRQLGEARWWTLNYEPTNHEISLDILKEMDIKEKILLNSLDRFKKIRHDANYRGFRISVNQAQEIITFWDKCAIEIMKIIMNDLKSQLY
jgi:hypothetical protein